MIKFDLHIHSIASSYKEEAGMVDESTTENVGSLLRKLNDNDVSLFSVTDHNRFNSELYIRVDDILNSAENSYSKVKNIVAGVEFDVQFDDDMRKCHIITIFDAKNKPENYYKIESEINKNLIQSKDGAYTRKEFEELLQKIGLNVILIACQRSGLDRKKGKHSSLSESVYNTEEFLSTGYIDALEFQSPNVEGILKNNLKDIPSYIGLATGSDCHEWSAYPYHDQKHKNMNFSHSKANILPTFKGLVMAFTSPKTRVNCSDNTNPFFINNIIINDDRIPLVNGVNVIIGENGSGKSTLLNLLKGDTSQSYVKELIRKNNMEICDNGVEKINFIAQGSIVEKFNKGTLFSDNLYKSVDHTDFENAYRKYAEQIYEYIDLKIKSKEALSVLKEKQIVYDDIINNNNYFVSIKIPELFGDTKNPHCEKDTKLDKIIQSLEKLKQDTYYDRYIKEINDAINILMSIYNQVNKLNLDKQAEVLLRNTIISAVNNYETSTTAAAGSRENEKRSYNHKKQDFIDSIVKAVNYNSRENIFPKKPDIIKGRSVSPKHGFNFNCEAKYDEKDVSDIFLSRMFNKEYSSVEKLQTITSLEQFRDAVRMCTDTTNIREIYYKNLDTFISEQEKCAKYIVDNSEGTLGSTLGELSLAYFKYIALHDNESNVLLIDQPEDHISNNNICSQLSKYINQIRYKKQIVIVTHNPLLVVNQDADQVIYLKKINDTIKPVSGCLEYEDENINMLDIIADNMDGGRSSIEKRLKVYGKEH